MVVKFDKDTSTHPPRDPQVWYEVGRLYYFNCGHNAF
jgi:hypothetical protein